MTFDLLRRFIRGESIDPNEGSFSVVGPDFFQLSNDTDLAAEHQQISAHFEAVVVYVGWPWPELHQTRAGRRIVRSKPEAQARYLRAALERMADDALYRKDAGDPRLWASGSAMWDLVGGLLKRRPPMDRELVWAALTLTGSSGHVMRDDAVDHILREARRVIERQGLDEDLEVALAGFRRAANRYGNQPQLAAAANEMLDGGDTLLAPHKLELAARLSGPAPPHYEPVAIEDPRSSMRNRLLVPDETWSDHVNGWLASLALPKREAWTALLAHCRKASGRRPSPAWNKKLDALAAAVGRDRITGKLVEWLPLIDRPKGPPVFRHGTAGCDVELTECLHDANGDVLKCLVRAVGTFPARGEVNRALRDLACSCYRRVRGRGPRAAKVGNACVNALAAIPGDDALHQLAYLKIRIKFGTAQKLIAKAFEAAAERQGLAAGEIEEMAVPAFGMTEVGFLREELGSCAAEVAVDSAGKVVLRWFGERGKAQKSVPARVKKDFKDELKELKGIVKDAQKMLAAQKERLDKLFLEGKTWSYGVWRDRYLDHPLVGVIARRLIWQFRQGGTAASGAWRDGAVVGVEDEPLEIFGGTDVEVSLWHPLEAEAGLVAGWRRWLERHQVRQPFKQAHREIYRLTEAELATEIYSNRFASHIIKQHQYHALCRARGWKNTLLLLVDDEFPATSRAIPWIGLRAEFWVTGLGNESGEDINDRGVFHYLTTDQVRFYRIDAMEHTQHSDGSGYGVNAEEPLPLAEVPALVFSEILRDVDLFIGVCSVGNDPAWADGGRLERFVEYSRGWAFGDLNASAVTRRELLSELVPRLKIADRVWIENRFLLVRGDLTTYKIHLGSGNVLMAPRDEYLCIVPKQSARDPASRVFLPFEDDTVLSLILSKAFLLAADARIKDRMIASQIQRAIR